MKVNTRTPVITLQPGEHRRNVFALSNELEHMFLSEPFELGLGDNPEIADDPLEITERDDLHLQRRLLRL